MSLEKKTSLVPPVENSTEPMTIATSSETIKGLKQSPSPELKKAIMGSIEFEAQRLNEMERAHLVAQLDEKQQEKDQLEQQLEDTRSHLKIAKEELEKQPRASRWVAGIYLSLATISFLGEYVFALWTLPYLLNMQIDTSVWAAIAALVICLVVPGMSAVIKIAIDRLLEKYYRSTTSNLPKIAMHAFMILLFALVVITIYQIQLGREIAVSAQLNLDAEGNIAGIVQTNFTALRWLGITVIIASGLYFAVGSSELDAARARRKAEELVKGLQLRQTTIEERLTEVNNRIGPLNAQMDSVDKLATPRANQYKQQQEALLNQRCEELIASQTATQRVKEILSRSYAKQDIAAKPTSIN